MQRVLVSIDTEGPAGSLPVERMIYGKLSDDKEYGIRYLMDFLDARNIKGLFFVDIAEVWDYGKEKIKKVLLDIERQGHAIGVHVHPDHMGDTSRRYLWQYTYEEQLDILTKCTDFYRDVLQRQPLSFRAGRYGANNDTLEVLSKLGYHYDMSEFYSNRYCKIDPQLTWNKMKRYKETKLIEVPVTTYRSISTPWYSRNDQIDSGLICSEFNRNMRIIEDSQQVDVVSMFMHSFQVLDWRKNPDHPVVNKEKVRRIETNFNSLLSNTNILFIEEKDLVGIPIEEDSNIGSIDVSRGVAAYYYFALRAARVIHDRLVRNV